MVKFIFIYMHICKCKHYTHEDDVVSAIFDVASTIKFNFLKYSILRYCAYFKHLVLMGRKIDNLNF